MRLGPNDNPAHGFGLARLLADAIPGAETELVLGPFEFPLTREQELARTRFWAEGARGGYDLQDVRDDRANTVTMRAVMRAKQEVPRG